MLLKYANYFLACPRGVVVYGLRCDIIVREFEFKSCFVYFQTKPLGNI